ncbi:MAG: hypothetical protein WC583_01180 [Candidatus Omnitrophota bacterium]|nr:hypothetical protein [Candidatus Omnitrophota bacterium]
MGAPDKGAVYYGDVVNIRSLRGMNLMEAVVSSILLALVMFGMMAVFTAGKRHSVLSTSKTVAGQLAYKFFSFLPMHVRADTWDASGNELTASTYYCGGGSTPQSPNCLPLSERTLNRLVYSAKYEVQDFHNLRRVKLTVNWTEYIP